MLLSGSDFGISKDTWETAKSQARTMMIERARKRGTIPYSDLVQVITAIQFKPRDIRLFHLLGEISSEEDAASRGMLTVVVVHKNGDMQPGPGFFELAKHLGRNTTDILKCWISELKRVHAIWSKPSTS